MVTTGNYGGSMFKTGDRVAAVVWGQRKEGTVTHHRSSVVWVQWDGCQFDQWYHPESLEVVSHAET